MLVSLEDMEEKINEDGLVVKMPQGSYTIERAHPLLQPYNAMVKNYNATLKQLNDLLPNEMCIRDRYDNRQNLLYYLN